MYSFPFPSLNKHSSGDGKVIDGEMRSLFLSAVGAGNLQIETGGPYVDVSWSVKKLQI